MYENRFLWQFEKQRSFFEEKRFVFAEAPRPQNPERQPAPVEDARQSFIQSPFEILGETRTENLDLNVGFTKQTNALYEWFYRIQVFSEEAECETRFAALFEQSRERTAEMDQMIVDAEEANELRRALGLDGGSSGTNAHLAQALRETSLAKARENFMGFLQNQYNQQQAMLLTNLQWGMKQNIVSAQKDASNFFQGQRRDLLANEQVKAAIVQPITHLDNEKEALQKRVDDLYKLENLESVRAGEAYQAEIEKYLEVVNCSEETPRTELTTKEKEQCFINAIAASKEELRNDIEAFERRTVHIRRKIVEFQKLLDENSEMSVEDIKKKIVPQAALALYVNAKGDTLDTMIQEKLEKVRDPILRALIASEFIANGEQMAKAFEASGDLAKYNDPAEIAQFQQEKNERAAAVADALKADTESVEDLEKRIKSANGGLVGIEKTYIYENINEKGETEVKINTKTGQIVDVKSRKEKDNLDPKSRTRVKEVLSDYKKTLRNYTDATKLLKINQKENPQTPEESENNAEIQKEIQELSKKVAEIVLEIQDLERKIEDHINKQSVAGQASEFEIKLVSPIAIWGAIENIYKIFVDEIGHDQNLDAAAIQKNMSGAANLAILPNFARKCLGLAEKKGDIEKENLDAKERGEFKYENHSNYGLLKVFYEWEDLNEQHLRAILEEMGKRGLIRWEDHRLWDHLYALTGLKMPEQAKTNANIRDTNLNMMFIQTFKDENWFKNQKNANSKGFIAEYEKKSTEAKKINTQKRTAKTLAAILEAHYEYAKKDLNGFGQMDAQTAKTHQFEEGESHADPHLFTSMLINQMSTLSITAEEMFFYLIRGIATGLVPYDFLAHFDGDKLFFNQWPALNVLRRITYAEILQLDRRFTNLNKEIVKNEPDEWQKRRLFKGDRIAIMKYLFNDLSVEPGVEDRTNRVIEKWDGTDKDIQYEALNKVSPSEMINLLGKFSGRSPLGSAKQKNGITGWTARLSVFDTLDTSPLSVASPQKRVKSLANSLATGLLFFAANDGRVKEDKFQAMGEADWTSVSVAGKESGLTTRESMNITQNFIATFLQAIPETSIGIWSKTEVLNTIFKKGGDADLQNKMIRQLTLGGDLEKFINGNQDTFKFLIDEWQLQGAFATPYDPRNSKILRSAGDNFRSIDASLKLSPGFQTGDRFRRWQDDPLKFRKEEAQKQEWRQQNSSKFQGANPITYHELKVRAEDDQLERIQSEQSRSEREKARKLEEKWGFPSEIKAKQTSSPT